MLVGLFFLLFFAWIPYVRATPIPRPTFFSDPIHAVLILSAALSAIVGAGVGVLAWFRSREPSIWVAISVLVGVLSACAPPSQEARREQVLRGYIGAVNANDVDAALSYHTPDAEFLIPGQNLIRGTEPMRALLQWDSVLASQIRFEPESWAGDTLVVGPGVERNAWFSGVGIDSIRYGAGTRFVFEGDRIKGVYPSALEPESLEAFQTRVGAFLGWAQTNAPEVEELAPGGLFTYDRESAAAWLVVLDRYRDGRED